MSVRENNYQRGLIKRISQCLPGCLILKNDPNYCQGVPDLLVLYGNLWVMLEVKASKSAPARPNQKLYVERLNNMGFARFVYPENEEAILEEIVSYLRSCRAFR